MSKHVPESFRALCQAYVTDDGVLVAWCECGGKRYESRVALAPIMERIKSMLRRYHQDILHGDMKKETISGLGSWFKSASDTASRIAHSKAVKQIYQSHLKYRKEILAATAMIPPPYGIAISSGLAVGYKVHDKIVAAKKGDPQALATLAELKAKAEAGNPKAQEAWNSALAIKIAMDAKESKIEAETTALARNPYQWGMGYGHNTPGASGPNPNESVSGWGGWDSSDSGWGYGHGDDTPGAAGDDFNELISGRKRRKLSKKQRRERARRLALARRGDARRGDDAEGEAPQAPPQAASPQAPGKARQDDDDDDDMEARLLAMEEALARGEDISGFFYNRPYRASRNPGKLNLRNLYNLGLGQVAR